MPSHLFEMQHHKKNLEIGHRSTFPKFFESYAPVLKIKCLRKFANYTFDGGTDLGHPWTRSLGQQDYQKKSLA